MSIVKIRSRTIFRVPYYDSNIRIRNTLSSEINLSIFQLEVNSQLKVSSNLTFIALYLVVILYKLV